MTHYTLIPFSDSLHLSPKEVQVEFLTSKIKPKTKIVTIYVNPLKTQESYDANPRAIFATASLGHLTVHTLQRGRGEHILDNYYNLINTFFYEDFHNSRGYTTVTPHSHFYIGKQQFEHYSYSKTTTAFQ